MATEKKRGVKSAWSRFWGGGKASRDIGSREGQGHGYSSKDPQIHSEGDPGGLAARVGVPEEELASYGVEICLNVMDKANRSAGLSHGGLHEELTNGAAINLRHKRPDDWMELVPAINTAARSGYFLRVVELERTQESMSVTDTELIRNELEIIGGIDGADAVVSTAYNLKDHPTKEGALESGWPAEFRKAIAVHYLSGLQNGMQDDGIPAPPLDLLGETFWFGYMLHCTKDETRPQG
jgi:hypothetical protein